jgi:ribosomal protein S18 acetylase RimI-like enzyme
VARRRGVGRRLVDGAEAWARERGLSSMRLRSRVTRVEAHAFYRRLGYEPVKQQLQFRKAL